MKFLKSKSLNVRSKFDAINKVKEVFAKLDEAQRLQTFALMWEGQQIQNIPIIRRLVDKMPGKQYKKIYSNLNQVFLFYEFKQVDHKTLNELEKQLLNAYKSDAFTCRSRHLTQIMKSTYPIFKARIEKIVAHLRENNFVDMDLFWLKNDLTKDLIECEEWEKNRFMKDFGLIPTKS